MKEWNLSNEQNKHWYRKSFSADFMQGPMPPAMPIVGLHLRLLYLSSLSYSCSPVGPRPSQPALKIALISDCWTSLSWLWIPIFFRLSWTLDIYSYLQSSYSFISWTDPQPPFINSSCRSQRFSAMLSILLILVGISKFTDCQSPAACNCFDCKVSWIWLFFIFW